jgi:hypothetical protein
MNFASLPIGCASTVETRYFKNASVTVNGLSAYALATDLSETFRSTYKYVTTYYSGANVGIDVAVRHADGTETGIISKGAQVSITQGDSYVLKSATVNAPQTSLANTDSIVVRVYCQLGTTWYLIGSAVFTTEQLGASSLDAATWTVYYYLSMSGTIGKNTYVYFFWDDSYQSRIEGFTWTSGVSKTWHDVASWNFQLLTRKWNNITSWSFNLITKTWHETITWIFQIETRKWRETALWTFQTLTRKWNEIIQWMFQLGTKKWYDIASWTWQTATYGWHTIAQWTFTLITNGWHTITVWRITIGGTSIPTLFIGILFFAAIIFLTLTLLHEKR